MCLLIGITLSSLACFGEAREGRQCRTMAFRDHNPNVLSPILSRDKTWSNGVASPAKKSSIIIDSLQLPAKPSSSNEQDSEHEKDNGSVFLLDIFNDFEEYQDKSNELTGSDHTKSDEEQKVETKVPPPGTQFPALVSPSIVDSNVAVPAEIAAVWSKNNDNIKLTTGAQLQDNASASTLGLLTNTPSPAAPAITTLTPQRANVKRTNVLALAQEHKNICPSNDVKSLQEPPAMIRKARAMTPEFSLEKLTSALPVRTVRSTTKTSTPSLLLRLQQQEPQPKMKWADAASMHLPPGYSHPLPPAKKTVQPFSIYTDREFQQHMQLQQQKATSQTNLDAGKVLQ